MPHIFLIPEPELFFGGNNKCLDPQVGLLKFGPHGGVEGQIQKVNIRAGVIGSDRSISSLRTWLERLRYRIAARETKNIEYKGIDFPGLNLDGPLGFDIKLDNNCVSRIDRKFIRNLKQKNRKERIRLAAKEYCEKFEVLSEADPQPQIILLPIDDELLSLCKEPYQKTDKIIYQRRELGDPESTEVELFDFHNYLKARAALKGLVTQMILPDTLAFSEKRQGPALIAWNVAVGIYYKATGIPWKLADIDDRTCYVGISFYNEIGKAGGFTRASIAQVYMRTGESQVIRGKPFVWNENIQGRNVHLSSLGMKEIVRDSIELFLKQRGIMPRRLVIHKSTRYTEDELIGCEEATQNIDEVDIANIAETGFKAYHDKYDYPVVRGTVIANSKEAMLYTSGFIPAIGTYPGATVPRPLHIICQRLDTSLEMVCRDVLSLTKLDWNSSMFYTRVPVTIGVSRKVGAVMAEMALCTTAPPSSYKFFM